MNGFQNIAHNIKMFLSIKKKKRTVFTQSAVKGPNIIDLQILYEKKPIKYTL